MKRAAAHVMADTVQTEMNLSTSDAFGGLPSRANFFPLTFRMYVSYIEQYELHSDMSVVLSCIELY